MTYSFIITFSSKYSFLVDTFMNLFKRCSIGLDKKVYVSLDEDVPFPIECDDKYISKSESLPERIRQIALKHPDEVYICLLGDAFITKQLDLQPIIDELKGNNFEYCNLVPKIEKNPRKSYVAKLKTNQRYGVSFIAFVATYEFIDREFNGISDYDFEIKYLKECVESKNKYLPNKYIVRSNVFGIIHGISNGKWNREAYRYLKKNGIEINSDLPLQTRKEAFKNWLSDVSSLLVPTRARYRIKRFLKKLGLKSKTDY